MMSRRIAEGILLACLIIAAGCAGSGRSVMLDPDIRLTVRFQDRAWDGIEIPMTVAAATAEATDAVRP